MTHKFYEAKLIVLHIMLINCLNCKKDFLLNKSEIDLVGKLISCKHCDKEWIYDSRAQYLETKLFELELELKQYEVRIIEQNTDHEEKIQILEKELKNQKEELHKQKILEDKINLFEKRITNTEKGNSYLADLEIKRNLLENEVKKTSDNILNKNKDIEKKTNYLQMKINPLKNENKINDPVTINEISNDVVNLKTYDHAGKNKNKSLKKNFFWSSNSDK